MRMVGSRVSLQPGKTQRGAFVVLVGPDGVGKTSVARALVELYGGATGYVHFRPPFWSPLAHGPDDVEYSVRLKQDVGGTRVLGWCRIIWSLAVFWAGFLRRIRPAVNSGHLVVGDRWGYGYYAQPHGLRFYGPSWLAVLVIRLLPRPDLVANLTVSPEVISQRKQELTADQLATELRLWGKLPVQKTSVEASSDAGTVARAVYDLIS
jgi:thymidylate kinase